MQTAFKTFRSFAEPELAQKLAATLEKANILYNIHDSRRDFDPTFSNSMMGKEILVQILPQDFDQAETLASEKTPFIEEAVNPDHPLLQFDTEELQLVVKNAQEWHNLDVELAKSLLLQKGIVVSEQEIATAKQQQLAALSQPENIKWYWMLFAYFSAALGGPLGLLIGWYLATLKKTLPDGSQVYNYDKKDRQHGKVILTVGFCSVLIMIIYNFNT